MTNLPVSGTFTITATYNQINKKLWSTYHKGVDIVSNNKTIYGTCDGTVRVVAYDANGWGHYVSVGDSKGNKHLFCHLAAGSIKVKAGQKVSRTTVIGTMGATGHVTGVHLHYQINNSSGKDINPCEHLRIPNEKGTYNSKDYHIDAVKPYNDDSNIASWAKDAVYTLKKKGIMVGDEKGNFNPTKGITRQEIAVMVANICKVQGYSFKTVPYKMYNDHSKIAGWAVDEVYDIKEFGLMIGDEKGNFNPTKCITRQESAVLFKNLYNGSVNIRDVKLYADDKKISGWAKDEVYALRQLGIMVGGSNNMFNPTKNITRQEAALLACNLINKK